MDDTNSNSNSNGGRRAICECTTCQGACIRKPGWFMPGEVEKVAEFLGVGVKKVFDSCLGVDWWVGDGELSDIFILSPMTITMKIKDDKVFPFSSLGMCVFYLDNVCKIHPVAPYECQRYMHTDSMEIISMRHREVALAWNDDSYQMQIEELLGYSPYAKSASSIFDEVGLLSPD